MARAAPKRPHGEHKIPHTDSAVRTTPRWDTVHRHLTMPRKSHKTCGFFNGTFLSQIDPVHATFRKKCRDIRENSLKPTMIWQRIPIGTGFVFNAADV
jgi:hypothetical protein